MKGTAWLGERYSALVQRGANPCLAAEDPEAVFLFLVFFPNGLPELVVAAVKTPRVWLLRIH